MKYLTTFVILIFILIPLVVKAQTGEQETKLYEFLEYIESILYTIGLILAGIVILVGGIMYLVSAGDDTKIAKAKKILLYGIIGAAIILAAGAILSLVEGILTEGGILD